jgi:FkbM family methyltransferase
MNTLSWTFSKLKQISNLPRYAAELPSFVRGAAKAKTVWGDIMWVPFPEHRCVVESGLFDGEEEVLQYFNDKITQNDIFFDAGSNAGFYSLFARAKGAEVHAFEPFPDTFRLLQKNIHANGGTIHGHETAVSNETGFGFMQGKGPSGYNKISERGTVKVKTLRLDDFPVVPTIMKVDVEGHDLEAMQGAEQMLRKHKPILVVECDTSMDFLLSLGYKATLLGKEKKRNYAFEM